MRAALKAALKSWWNDMDKDEVIALAIGTAIIGVSCSPLFFL